MLYIGFDNRTEALKHRSQHGGWVFIDEAGENVIWFSMKFKASDVFTHRATQGLSGKLI